MMTRITSIISNSLFVKLVTILIVYVIAILTRVSLLPLYNTADLVNHDTSWRMALVTTFRQGDLLGRDIYFTYGVLAQIIATLATKLNVADDPVYSGGLILGSFLALFTAALALAIILVRQLDWK